VLVPPCTSFCIPAFIQICCCAVLQVAGRRYNHRSGLITITCDKHRAREENRRQALHWVLRLVEAALIHHPSDVWEDIKTGQNLAMSSLFDTAEPEVESSESLPDTGDPVGPGIFGGPLRLNAQPAAASEAGAHVS
jgi:hypothetical protein